MYFDTFDPGFGMAPAFDPFCGGFGAPMFNGTGCFPAPSFDFGGMPPFGGGFMPSFDSGFGMGMPITCGYSPAPLGFNPVSMDLSGNVCIDGIPITPSTPPAWMTARATLAEIRMQEFDAQLNNPNLWMNFIPQSFSPAPFTVPDWQPMNFDSSADTFVPSGPTDFIPMPGMASPMDMDMDMGFNPDMGMDMGFNPGMDMGFNPGMDMGMDMGFNPGIDADSPTMSHGEEVLPCGLTQSQYDKSLSVYQKIISDSEELLQHCGPYQSAQRAMIQNNIDRAQRNIRDLDKPLGKI